MFTRLEIVRSSAPARLPASIKLTQQGDNPPRCNIAIADAIADEAGFADGDEVELLLGKDKHLGKLRLHKVAGGGVRVKQMMRGSFSLRCGHVPAFGLTPKPKIFCAATAIEKGTVEISLPAWATEE
jgi:hypothetical protein